ncbi:hypothetical protein PENTCL1PPCAC_29022, partial [Pristionchus entomophagus]
QFVAPQACGQVKVNPVAAAQSFLSNQTGQALIGGTEAKDGSWPWTVSICIQDWFGGCEFHAAGTIIGDRWVVTTWSGVDQPVKEKSFRVRVGSTDHRNGGQLLAVQSIWKQHDASTFDHYNDIALLELQTPISFNDYVQPICLPNAPDNEATPGKQAWFTGWGHSSNNAFSTMENYLRQAQMTFVDGRTCSDLYINYHNDVQLCVGAGSIYTCNYDQGGPLMQQRNGRWYLFGIAATKDYINCTQASIFTRAVMFCDFIRNTSGISCID